MTTESSKSAADLRREHLSAYVAWIRKECGDPGTRAALRAGVGRDLNHVRPMHRIVAPWLPRHRHVPEAEERAFYLVASMIADRPRHTFAAEDESDNTVDEETTPAGMVEADGPASAPANEGEDARAERWGRSLGHCLAQAVVDSPGRERDMRASAAEARLDLLTRQSTAGLHRHLPATVRHLSQTGVDVDWVRLMQDLIAWPTLSGRISRRWLQDYYRETTRNRNEKSDQEDQAELLLPSADDTP
ncbi:type I-E CRISPR-associated protein Cse2/CasB [Streptomyces sp. NPDC056144]|uniref:type I-E CRISPR-associated protein Cse2/CasB n=1 Tax=unclassified Streptomyces TaxID=2593676 RepID=UPI0035E1FEFD